MSQKEQLAKLAVEWLKGYKADERSLPELLEAAFLLGARAMQEKSALTMVTEGEHQYAEQIRALKPEELL